MLRLALLTAALAGVAAPAVAQNTDSAPAPASTLPDPNDNGDQLTIGVGGAYVPDTAGRAIIG